MGLHADGQSFVDSWGEGFLEFALTLNMLRICSLSTMFGQDTTEGSHLQEKMRAPKP